MKSAGASGPLQAADGAPGPLRARQALDLVHGAVDLDDAARVGAGSLMQAVDVLRDDRDQSAAALEIDQRPVPGIRLRGPGGMLSSGAPRGPAYLWVFDVVRERR